MKSISMSFKSKPNEKKSRRKINEIAGSIPNTKRLIPIVVLLDIIIDFIVQKETFILNTDKLIIIDRSSYISCPYA